LAGSLKTIATINFKGGVGKTTVTWCLAHTLATYSDANVLMFDLDAQMSLTQAVGLNEDSGSLYPAFGSWYDKRLSGHRTIFDAIDQFTSLLHISTFRLATTSYTRLVRASILCRRLKICIG
jgi:cellulose biosynthesis protein BcsQ